MIGLLGCLVLVVLVAVAAFWLGHHLTLAFLDDMGIDTQAAWDTWERRREGR